MYDLSIIIHTIRTHLLEVLYDSICKSCNKHSFEVIFVGPFDIPLLLLEKENVRYIKDYGQPTRAVQIGLLNVTGELTCWITDDCFCYPNTLSNTVDLYNKECVETDIVGMRFFENPEHYKAIKEGITTEEQPVDRLKNHPDSYWYAGLPYRNLGGVKPHWGIACLFVMNTHILKMYGGWDCQFEYMNHGTHDLLFRIQKNGNRFFLTDYDVFVANWYEGTTKDHAPVHYGQTYDQPLFTRLWHQSNNRGQIDIENWQNYPEIWERRFGQEKPCTYKELYGKQ